MFIVQTRERMSWGSR